MDFGFTNDPTAIVEVRESGKDLYLDEIAYKKELLASDIIGILKPYRNMKIICDSADPRLIEELYRADLDAHAVKKSHGSIMAGITKVKEYRLKVTRRSANIVKELKNYTFRQDKNGHWLNEPIDAYNHACDAFRNVVLSEILGQGDNDVCWERSRKALSNLIHR